MQSYACGFLFSPDRARVLLIRKGRPAWQAGKLNGIGGKLEPGESPLDAMRREFREEAALEIDDWHEALILSGRDDAGSGIPWRGHFFRAFGPIDDARTMTDEPLEIHPAAALPHNVIPNLRWMIPLLLDDEPLSGAYHLDVR
ncbi:MAG TPA: NUDIX domain-containing protein [Tepidisphaeraceae bacterium]|nr:NUDIX domain-containing protein [Tepidisphaeraceae bacterium]